MKRLDRILGAVIMLLMLRAATAYAASVTLEVDPGGQAFDTIRLHMANLPRDFVFSDPPIYVGEATRFTVSGLLPNQTYKFIAVLTKGDTRSPGSNVVQTKTPPAYAAPKVTATSNGTETVFTFDTGTVTPTRYLIRVAEELTIPGSQVTEGVLYESASSPIKVIGLVQGKKYNFYGQYTVGTERSPKSSVGNVSVPVVVTIKAPGLVIIKEE